MAINYTPDQEKAAELIKDWYNKESSKRFVLAGYAGTGKTTLLKEVIRGELGLVPNENAMFVTPTGKAATVLIRKGIPASTVHHLIYDTETYKRTAMVDGQEAVVTELRFTKKDELDPKIKLIVLDETSMVSDKMLEDLSSFGVKILMCGDSAQLPPVNAVNTILSHPDFTLTTIVRQEKDNPIIKLSEIVRKGRDIPYRKYGNGVQVISKERTDPVEMRDILTRADMIICGINDTRRNINGSMRTYLGYGTALPQNGEKLLCSVTKWTEYVDRLQKYNLVKGLIGFVDDVKYDLDQGIGFAKFRPDFDRNINPYVIPFDVGNFTRGLSLHGDDTYFRSALADGLKSTDEPFKLNEFEYGYCITCHKAQGSEYDRVVVIDESMIFKENSLSWLYTAITRAKKELTIIR